MDSDEIRALCHQRDLWAANDGGRLWRADDSKWGRGTGCRRMHAYDIKTEGMASDFWALASDFGDSGSVSTRISALPPSLAWVRPGEPSLMTKSNSVCNRHGKKPQACSVWGWSSGLPHGLVKVELDDISLSILVTFRCSKESLFDIGDTDRTHTAMPIDYTTCGVFKGKELATSLLCKLCFDPSFIEAAYQCRATSPFAFHA